MPARTAYVVSSTAGSGNQFLDFELSYGELSLHDQEIVFLGSSSLDAIFVRPASLAGAASSSITYNLTATGAGKARVYFEGAFADYTLTNIGTSVQLERTTADGRSETIIVGRGTAANSDTLVFADGTVTSNQAFNQATSPATPSGETSLAPGAPADGSAALDAAMKIAVLDAAGATVALNQPGVSFQVIGSAGVDTVYVSEGATMTATALGGGQDIVYFRGAWADYTKSVAGTQMTFTRTVGGDTETVVVAAGAAALNDLLVFADGAVASLEAKNDFSADNTVALAAITGYDAATTTPGLAPASTPAVEALSVTSSAGASDWYRTGNRLTLSATFSEAVSVDMAGGAPRLALDIGGETVYAAYAGGTGSNVLRFSYSIGSGNLDTDGVSIAANALDANGAIITGAEGAAADLSHTALAADSAHRVDAVAPGAPVLEVRDLASNLVPAGAMEADAQLSVRVLLTGTGSIAGDRVQLYNGGASLIGEAVTLTQTDIDNGYVDMDMPIFTGGTALDILARIRDAAGNNGAASTPHAVTIDATPLDLTFARVADDDAISATETAGGLMLQGTADPGTAITASVSGVDYETAADAAGQWSFNFDADALAAFGLGFLSVDVTATDSVNTSATTKNIWITDTTENRAETDLLPIGWYSSLGVMNIQIGALKAMGGPGPYYGGVTTNANVWQTFADHGLKVTFPLTYPGPHSYANSGDPYPLALDHQNEGSLYKKIFDEVTAALGDPVKAEVISSWYTAEETRAWKPLEMQVTRIVVDAVRAAEDALNVAHRPIEHYQPNHADAARMDSFPGLYDIMSKGNYIDLSGGVADGGTSSSANPYTTFIAASGVIVTGSRGTVAGVANSGAVGADYTPYLAFGAFVDPPAGTSDAAMDRFVETQFYAAFAGGLQGATIWSYATRSGFSAYWRDRMYSGFVEQASEVNEVLPELGQAMARGLRLENIAGAAPISYSSEQTGLTAARFFINGSIYVVMVNTSRAGEIAATLSDFGDFTRYREVLIRDSQDWQTTGTGNLTLTLAAEQTRIFQFVDPSTPLPERFDYAFTMNTDEMPLPRGLPGNVLARDGSGLVTPAFFGLAGETGDLDIQIWGRETFFDAYGSYFYHTDNPGVWVTRFSLADVRAGKIAFFYSGEGAAPSFSIRLIDADGAMTDWTSAVMSFGEGPGFSGGEIIWGDGSGDATNAYGAYAPLYTRDGGGGADALNGTGFADIIFGDGSGASHGWTDYGSQGYGAAGAAGGGDDVISGGAGNDLLFGDGWAANADGAGYGGGGGGYQNSGAEVVGEYGGLGAGGGYNMSRASWLGEMRNTGKLGGAGVNAASGDIESNVTHMLGERSTLFAFDRRGVYNKVLWDLSEGTTGFGRGNAASDANGSGNGGTNIDQRLYAQTMGAGADTLRGGTGNDWLMGGGGGDIFLWAGDDFDQGTDYIVDFNAGAGDKIDIRSLLGGYAAETSTVNDWVTLETGLTAGSPFERGNGTYSKLDIDADQDGTVDQTILFRSDALSAYADAAAMLAAGALVVI